MTKNWTVDMHKRSRDACTKIACFNYSICWALKHISLVWGHCPYVFSTATFSIKTSWCTLGWALKSNQESTDRLKPSYLLKEEHLTNLLQALLTVKNIIYSFKFTVFFYCFLSVALAVKHACTWFYFQSLYCFSMHLFTKF